MQGSATGGARTTGSANADPDPVPAFASALPYPRSATILPGGPVQTLPCPGPRDPRLRHGAVHGPGSVSAGLGRIAAWYCMM